MHRLRPQRQRRAQPSTPGPRAAETLSSLLGLVTWPGELFDSPICKTGTKNALSPHLHCETTVCSENTLGKLGEGACGSDDACHTRSRPERAVPTRHPLAAPREGWEAGGSRPLLGHHACVTEPADRAVVPEYAHEACVDSWGRLTH